MLKAILAIFTVSATAIAVAAGAGPGDFKPETIVALERAALDRWSEGDPQGFVELFAPEVTYFDPYQKKRVGGLEAMKEIMAPVAGTFTIPRYEMIGPKVQRHGSVAILTFNLVNYDRAGNPTSRWNSTEVYCQFDGAWKIIHSHWSQTAPPRKQENPE